MSFLPELTSPSKALTSQVADWGVVSTETDTRRTDLKNEIVKKVLYDRSDIIETLLVPSLPDALTLDMPPFKKSVVDFVVTAVTTECASALKTLKRLAKKANSGEEDEEDCEVEMYPHLAEIFRTVETTCVTAGYNRAHFRQLVLNPSASLASDDPILPRSFHTKPDFVVAEVPPPSSGTLTETLKSAVHPLRWRQCPAFLEVKAANADSPIPQYKDKVKQTLVQGADYARAILSSRPFQLHVFGVFVTGALFCVARFDRRGIQLSPEFNIFSDKGIRQLVTVVLRLIWDMSPVDLGHDPTVSLLPGYTYYGEEYPRFNVKMSTHPLSEGWRTVGPPLWSSHSLFGRGTSVWRSVNASTDQPQILKNAWHSVTRPTESEIYQKIRMAFNDSVPRGIATTPAGGGEVHIGRDQRATVFAMRRLPELSPPTVTDAALHRVALNDFGKPIWRFVNAEQFIGAILSILKATRALREVGILHRDISAGNVLIKVDASWQPPVYKHKVPGKRLEVEIPDGIVEEELNDVEGLLTDFEFASFTDPPTGAATSWPPRTSPFSELAQEQHARSQGIPLQSPDKEPGDGMTGTAVFMATALLNAIEKDKVISRTFEQDMESLAYVVLYSLYKHALADCQVTRPGATAMDEEFKTVFGAVTVQNLMANRRKMFVQENISNFPHLLDYYHTRDLSLRFCAIATIRFLCYVSQEQRHPADDQQVQLLNTLFKPQPTSSPPFEDTYKGWLDGLLMAAFIASGAQGDKDEWLKSQSAHYFH